MKKEGIQKNVILCVSVFIIVIILLGILFYINIKKHASVTIEATIKYLGEDSMIVVDENHQEYSLPIQENYNVGDKVSVTLKNIDENTDPREGELVQINTISKSVQFIIMDSTSEVENSQKEENENNIASDTKIESTETDVITFLEEMNQKFDQYQEDKSIGDTLKSGFVTMVDFLFYDGTIQDKTFKELSNEAKLKVLSLALSIDNKIEKYFPNYKETISSTSNKIYTNIKEKVLASYLDITTEVCQKKETICTTAKNGLAELKNSFSLTWDFIKNISGIGLSKLKAWYEVWKDAE